MDHDIFFSYGHLLMCSQRPVIVVFGKKPSPSFGHEAATTRDDSATVGLIAL